VVEKDAPRPLQAGEYLAYLSQSALEFVGLPREADIYRHIATRLQALLGESVVVVASYDRETRELCQRAVAGAGQWLDALSSVAGQPLEGFRHILNAEAEQQINVGRLVKVEEGLYEALLRAVPRPVTRTIEKIVGIRAVYGMGCVAGGECFGSILMLLRSDQGMAPPEVVETFVGQAALALQRHRAETVLRRNEEQLRTLMEQAPDAYLVMTTDGVICDVNPACCKATGYARAAMVGRPIVDFLDANEMVGKPFAWERVRKREIFTDTRRLRCADGSSVVFEARLAPLLDGHVLVMARDITERRRLEKEVTEASRREREQVGRDLHDSLGQQLAGLSCLCAALGQQLASRQAPEAADAERIAALLGASVSQTRRIAQGLCLVDVAASGVSAALASLADYVSTVLGVSCSFSQNGEDVIPRDATASHLYLIAQEATSNAVRHGRAGSIVIELHTRRGHGQLLIRDDGKGFSLSTVSATGLGLRIMKYRAGMIDGALDITSASSGTTVTCTFPLA
jgi:PAS domain S-box-containing protein